MITIEQIRELAADENNIQLTEHISDRCLQRKINLDDVTNVIRKGEIIEQYPDDYPFPSCLELGLTVYGKPLHVCIGISTDTIFVITAYYPSEDKWESDFKTRREK